MFCLKCGAKVLDGSEFCQKCGTKIIYEDTAPQMPDAHKAEPTQDTSTASSTSNDGSDFRAFVDNHVRASTQFQSAEELLNRKVSLLFVWICFGISIVLGIWLPPLLLITVPLGYVAAKVAGGIKKGRYAFKFHGKTDGKVNTDDLIQFLNTHLNYLQPYFHDWGYIKRKKQNLLTTSAGGTLQTLAEASARESLKEVGLCTDFGSDKRCLSILFIHADPSEGDLGKMEYVAAAGGRIESEGVAYLSHDFGFQTYKCVVRTAPILQAAMEYYLHNYKQN